MWEYIFAPSSYAPAAPKRAYHKRDRTQAELEAAGLNTAAVGQLQVQQEAAECSEEEGPSNPQRRKKAKKRKKG